jgi:TetR/AcrR family transcriptional repressor of bet genes
MEPIRRDALVSATIAEIGASGSLEVTVSAIARRAGVSPALAHHYFGSKEQIFLAAMRRILSDFGSDVQNRLKSQTDPVQRLHAIIAASFGPDQFDREIVAAWLAFYVQAQKSPEGGAAPQDIRPAASTPISSTTSANSSMRIPPGASPRACRP